MNPSTSSKAVRSTRRRTRITIYQAGPQKRPVCTNTVCEPFLKGLTRGEHGLPLIGSGDWNDGMNMVGEQGTGESVWLGFFLYDVLMQFTEMARLRSDLSFARTLPEGSGANAPEYRAAWLGWRVVSPCLL